MGVLPQITFTSLPLWVIILLFLASGALIVFAGIRLSALADQLADVTGMGEAIMGGVFLGGSTSLSGITVSIVAALHGFPQISLSNAIGGIAAQLTMLVIADLSYRRINLEHASASIENLMWGILQIILLGMLLFAMNTPPVEIFGISVITPLLFLVYGYGLVLIHKASKTPMWQPRMTRFTRKDVAEQAGSKSSGSAKKLWLKFALYALAIMAAGWLITRTGEEIVSRTQLSQELVGGVFLAVTTSMAELVTAIAAIHRGALMLAVGDILGGNAFDCLFAALSDVFYREGSIYQAATLKIKGLLSLTVIMAAILLMGLLARERTGVGRIGFEGVAIVACYVLGLLVLAWR